MREGFNPMRSLILFSGGLDSTVMLALALSQKKICLPISFEYGQTHKIELQAAKKIATFYQLPHQIIHLPHILEGHSALTEGHLKNFQKKMSNYVPARNTIFLAYATSLAEIWEADEIHFGCNAADLSNYPDCRPTYVEAFQQVLQFATQRACEGFIPKITTPLKNLDKKEIVKLGKALKVPLSYTWSCYFPQGEFPCGSCEACCLRNIAFSQEKPPICPPLPESIGRYRIS